VRLPIPTKTLALLPLLSVGGCALRHVHHTVRVKDPAALSVVATARGDTARTPLVLAGNGDPRPAHVAVRLRDPAGRRLPLGVSGARVHGQRPLLRLARGESLLVELPLLDAAGRLDGKSLEGLGLAGDGVTFYRDASGLIVARYGYTPAPPSLRQAFSFEWQFLTALFEDEPAPLRVEIVTPPENLEALTRVEAPSWEVTVVLTTLGIIMTGAGIAVLADTATRDANALTTGIGFTIGLSSIGFGALGLGVGLASMFAGEDVQPLDTGSLPALPP
jgi:hypothetical protein